jgi:hypothetical protein
MRPGRSLVLALALSLGGGTAGAVQCPDLPECCALKVADELDELTVVSVGLVMVGLYNVNEKSGTWDGDYYLYEAWTPQEGFAPQTEIVNEVARLYEGPADVWKQDDRCVRYRRIRSTLNSSLNLRLFPFDRQRLTVQLSDNWLSSDMRYQDKPFVMGVDDTVLGQLSQWDVGQQMTYGHESRYFKWEEGVWGDERPFYDYATFGVTVRRHTTFHLTKFFLPLLIIVLVSITVFWVDPDDLPSQVGIGVTCLLAAIAFQLAQASTLPEVAYLTLADLVFALSYLTIALALVESLYSNVLSRQGAKERALRMDRICRVAFPLGFFLLVGASALFSARVSG